MITTNPSGSHTNASAYLGGQHSNNANDNHPPSQPNSQFVNPVAEHSLQIFEPSLNAVVEAAQGVCTGVNLIRERFTRSISSTQGYADLVVPNEIRFNHTVKQCIELLESELKLLKQRINNSPKDIISRNTELLNEVSTEDRVSTTTDSLATTLPAENNDGLLVENSSSTTNRKRHADNDNDTPTVKKANNSHSSGGSASPECVEEDSEAEANLLAVDDDEQDILLYEYENDIQVVIKEEEEEQQQREDVTDNQFINKDPISLQLDSQHDNCQEKEDDLLVSPFLRPTTPQGSDADLADDENELSDVETYPPSPARSITGSVASFIVDYTDHVKKEPVTYGLIEGLTIASLKTTGDLQIVDDEVPGSSNSARITSSVTNPKETIGIPKPSLIYAFSSDPDEVDDDDDVVFLSDDGDRILLEKAEKLMADHDFGQNININNNVDADIESAAEQQNTANSENVLKKGESEKSEDWTFWKSYLRNDNKLQSRPEVLLSRLDSCLIDELLEKGTVLDKTSSDRPANDGSDVEEEDTDLDDDNNSDDEEIEKRKKVQAALQKLKREGETVTARAKSRQSTLASAANEGRKKITKRLRSGRVIHYSCSSDLDSETDDDEAAQTTRRRETKSGTQDQTSEGSNSDIVDLTRRSVSDSDAENDTDIAVDDDDSFVFEEIDEEEARLKVLNSSSDCSVVPSKSEPSTPITKAQPKIVKKPTNSNQKKPLLSLPLNLVNENTTDSDEDKPINPRTPRKAVILSSSDSSEDDEDERVAIPLPTQSTFHDYDESDMEDKTAESGDDSSTSTSSGSSTTSTASSSISDVNPSVRIAPSIFGLEEAINNSRVSSNSQRNAVIDVDVEANNAMDVLELPLTPRSLMTTPQSRAGRRDIRAINDERLRPDTIRAELEEQQRIQRLQIRQQMKASSQQVIKPSIPALPPPPTPPSQQIAPIVIEDEKEVEEEVDPEKRQILEYLEETRDNPLVEVHYKIAKHLKAHQREGVDWMWAVCFDSLTVALEKEGSGAILAHCMGLGKTIQVISLIHTVHTNPQLKSKFKTTLVICPKLVVGNWRDEFVQWQGTLPLDCQVPVHVLSKSKPEERLQKLQEWQEQGGVGLIHYNLFLGLCDEAKLLPEQKSKGKPKPPATNPRRKKDPNLEANILLKKLLLDPGPDILVLDEGHILKNSSTKTYKAVNLIKTKRKIVLTGTPLQNNLDEYYAMVNLIRPNLLGSPAEFSNRFKMPIENGQFQDSRDADVARMRKRTYKLNKLLEACIQRRTAAILCNELPKLHDQTIFVPLTPKQIEIYNYYMENFANKEALENGEELLNNKNVVKKENRRYILRDFQVVSKIIAHPAILKRPTSKEKVIISSKKKNKKKPVDIEDVEDHFSGSDMESILETTNDGNEKWFHKFLYNTECEDMERYQLGCKLVVLKKILEVADEIEERVLVFSQFLNSLDMIQKLLEAMDLENVVNREFDDDRHLRKGRWQNFMDYFRLDGETSVKDREQNITKFNLPSSRTKLFLISTKAGNLGVNLYGANRVVLFDSSWNPSLDLQAIFRAYRYGQTKEVYVYRLVGKHTLEEKVYNSQIGKQAMAYRVVEKKQCERSVNKEKSFYALYPTDENASTSAASSLVPNFTPELTSNDVILKRIFSDLQKNPNTKNAMHVVEHQSFLQIGEELTDQEKTAADTEFDAELEAERQAKIREAQNAAAKKKNATAKTKNKSPEQIGLENHHVKELKGKLSREPFNYSSEQIIQIFNLLNKRKTVYIKMQSSIGMVHKNDTEEFQRITRTLRRHLIVPSSSTSTSTPMNSTSNLTYLLHLQDLHLQQVSAMLSQAQLRQGVSPLRFPSIRPWQSPSATSVPEHVFNPCSVPFYRPPTTTASSQSPLRGMNSNTQQAASTQVFSQPISTSTTTTSTGTLANEQINQTAQAQGPSSSTATA